MKYFSLLFFVLLTFSSFAKNAPQDTVIIPNRMLYPTDSIELKIEGNSKFLIHNIRKGQTLYSIAKYYGLEVADIYYYNPALKTNIPLDFPVKIPVTKKEIYWYKNSSKYISWRAVEVVYIVKPKDTFYKIAKRNLNMPIDSLKAMNCIDTNTLEIGDKLVVGFIDIDGLPERIGVRAWLPINLYTGYKTLKEQYLFVSDNKRVIKEKGPATWNSKMKATSLYALHRTAPIGTILKVTNPLNNRTLYVKVVGKLQSAGYSYNTIVVLSPACVKSLGGVNTNFMVNIEYYK
jgi:LysM repeat protein